MTDSISINRIDALEPRFLLTSFASLNAAGVLGIVGTSQSNVINVAYSGSNVKVTRDGSTLYFAKTKVKKVWAESYGGNDKITIGVALPSTLIGDAGNDTLTGNVKDDQIHGGSGDDRLVGGDGSNLLDHGSGNDVLDYSVMPPGEFDLTDLGMSHPGTGVDIVGNDAATVLLTPGNDTFTWGGQNDELHSNLTVDGGAGNDAFRVNGFPYRGYIARLNGGAGNDTFWFDVEAGGVSYIDCGPGNDVITDNAAIKSPTNCDGGPGHDTYNMEFEWDFDGGAEVTVPPGIEEFSTNTDQYLIVHGNDLDNKITGSSNAVTLYGNGGNDELIANVNAINGPDPAHALIDGGSGNDTLVGNAATVFKGGAGNDTANFSAATSNLNITLDNKANDGAANDHANVMTDVENVIGGAGNDKITGSSANNILHGGKGNDSLYGGGGADALFGDEGNDVLDGGSGDDYLQGWTGNDALFGRDGNDKLDAGAGDDYLEGNAGNDTLTGGTGHDKMYGNDGNDTLFAKDGQKDSLDGGNGLDMAQRDNTSTIKDSVLNIESFI